MIAFTDLGLSKPVLSALAEAGYSAPTEIQEKSIPIIFTGADIMASAQTGSGKTAAFAIPIVECLQDPDDSPRALILVPTRELALQVEEQFIRFAKPFGLRTVTLYGGTGYVTQTKALQKGVDIVVATPGRLFDCMQKRLVDLSMVEMLVLDEADRLLDMGFMPQVRRIVSRLSKERQTLMFSATIDERVHRLASEFLNEPVTVKVNTQRIEPAAIQQRVYHVHEFNKDDLLVELLKENQMTSVIVFTNTKRRAAWVKDRLRDAKIQAEEIHGDITQSQRERTLSRYRDGDFPVLVATDVAARGLDISSITHVVNYDLPEAAEDYIHRIGRTGRAGRSGVAFSFVSEEQRFLVKDIEKLIGRCLDSNKPAAQQKTTLPPRTFSGGRRMA